MDAFEFSDLSAEQAQSGKLYLEFLRVPSLSLGLYALATGSDDPQQPHSEDEVYYVVSGRGSIRVAGEDRRVKPGSVIFVEAGVEHRFHSISEDLKNPRLLRSPRVRLTAEAHTQPQLDNNNSNF